MSEVKIVLRDAYRDIYARRHGGFVDRIVAALSAEPETLEELDAAVERFEAGDGSSFLRLFTPGLDDEPYDAGVVIVDLAARLVVCESSYSSPGHDDCVFYHDGTCETDVELRYRIADDWIFVRQALDWQALADNRRRERAMRPKLDAREVLYGKAILEWIAKECWRTLVDPTSGTDFDKEEEELPLCEESFEEGPHADCVRRIHIRWLTTARDDLGGQAPHDVLLAKREFINWDLQHRANQWSLLQKCPPGLDPKSHAFRFAGCGSHENFVYYDFVRNLIWSAVDHIDETAKEIATQAMTLGDFLTAEVPRLAAIRDEWWNAIDPELGHLSPREVVEHERARLPEGMSDHEAMIDEDCPLCEMLGDMPGPVFWHLDGCNNDSDFAFSFHRTREEWEKEERDRQEFDRRFNAEWEEKKQLQLDGLKQKDSGGAWQASDIDSTSIGRSPAVRLFAIGGRLAELIVDLKRPTEDRPLIDRLRRDFGNLREVAGSDDITVASALIEPVVQSFCETLDAVSEARADLQPKCALLQADLRRFVEDPLGLDESVDYDSDDDVPFES